MSTKSVWNAFANSAIRTESIQLNTTPTAATIVAMKQQSDHLDSSSILSLSNYLQYNDQSIFYHEKYPESNQRKDNKQQQEKNSMIIKKSHLFIEEYSRQSLIPFDQNSESMLLLESEIKQNHEGKIQDIETVVKDKLIQGREQSNKICYKISQRILQDDKHFYTQSMELINLLSIPKQPQPCGKCISFEKMIKTLQQFLASKQKQIKKYEELIDQLNSKSFDLKIQNKRLTFENQQYLNQIQTLLSQNTKIKSKQKLNTISYENIKNESFFDEECNEVISSAILSRALSRKKTVKQQQQDIKPISSQESKTNKQDCYRSPIKAYNQTPISKFYYLEPKHHQHKPNNSSDQFLQGSIFKFTESQFCQIAEKAIQQMFKDNNFEKQKHKRQGITQIKSHIKRFSDILSQTKSRKIDLTQNEFLTSGNLINNTKQIKSPLKKPDFLKAKEKQYSQSEDLIERKKSIGKRFQNNHDLLNKLSPCKGTLPQKEKVVENSYQVYKTFKEIGTTFNSIDNCNKQPQSKQQEKRSNFQSPHQSRYNYYHIKRNSLSPLPDSFCKQKQNTERQHLYSSPYAKQNQNKKQTQTNIFFR